MRMKKTNKQNKDVRFMLYVTEAALLWYYDIWIVIINSGIGYLDLKRTRYLNINPLKDCVADLTEWFHKVRDWTAVTNMER